MKTFKISSTFKFIYLGVIVTLLVLYFNAQTATVYNLNGLEVKEVSSVEYPLIPKRTISLNLKYRGLDFEISAKKPIEIISDDNLKRNSTVEDIVLENNSLNIYLANNITLSFLVDNAGRRLSISSSIPKVFPSIKEVVLPVKLTPGVSITESTLSYTITNNDTEYHLKINDKYFFNEDRSNIHLFSESDKLSTLTFSPLNNSDLPLAEQWYLANRDDLVDNIEPYFNDLIERSELYATNRFRSIQNIQNQGWINLPSLSQFDEDYAVIYLASALQSGNYVTAYNKIQAIKNRYPSWFTFKSAPFMGNIITLGKQGFTNYDNQANQISRMVNSLDSRVLNTDIPEEFFDGDLINTENLASIINNADKESMSIEQLTSSLTNLNKILQRNDINSSSNDSVKEISDLILKRIKWDSTGVYIETENELSDQLLNFKIGLQLIEASQYESSEYSKPAGEALITTYIRNSDGDGFNNQFYNLNDKTFSGNKIEPKEVYNLISKNPFLPHYVQQDGLKIWTISDSIDIVKNSRETRITVNFPVTSLSGSNSQQPNFHFLTISGVEPYNQLYFRGRNWRADELFERWGIGYYYEYSSNLLYFMPQHTKPREEILITY